jgi:MscS family membrane protein
MRVKDFIWIWVCWLFSVVVGFGQSQFVPKTPREAVSHHLYYLQPAHFDPDVAAQTLWAPKLSPAEKRLRAIQIKQLLDYKEVILELDQIPDTPDYRDSVSGKPVYVLAPQLFPEIYLQRIGRGWYYPPEVVEKIPKLYHQTLPLGTSYLLLTFIQVAPKNSFLGLFLWQYIALLVLLLLAVGLYYLFLYVFRKALRVVASRLHVFQLNPGPILRMARPLAFLIVFYFLRISVPLLMLPGNVLNFFVKIFNLFIPFYFLYIAYRGIDFVTEILRERAQRTESRFDDTLVDILSVVVKVSVVIVGILFILDNLGVNITSLLAGLSIGGLAFALAAQDTLKNFFASILILLDKPFQVNDWIQSGSIAGTVEEVGLRATRIRSFSNALLYVPNSTLVENPIENFGLRKFRRYHTLLGVEYSTTPEQLETFVEGLKQIVENHPKTRKDYYEVCFYEYGSSALVIRFSIYFEVPSLLEELQARHEINMAIKALAEKLEVRFAFPSTSLYVESLPDKPKPLSPLTYEQLRGRMITFFQSQQEKRDQKNAEGTI